MRPCVEYFLLMIGQIYLNAPWLYWSNDRGWCEVFLVFHFSAIGCFREITLKYTLISLLKWFLFPWLVVLVFMSLFFDVTRMSTPIGTDFSITCLEKSTQCSPSNENCYEELIDISRLCFLLELPSHLISTSSSFVNLPCP